MGESKEYVTHIGDKGNINISEDVISIIAGAAIQDVAGVDGSPTTIGTDIAEFLGKRSPSKGVKIQISDTSIAVDAYIMVRYGYVISDVAKDVQTAVCNAIESMTGLSVPVVNVHVCGITFDKDK